MFAWKSTLLFISVFCSAFLSKYSLGGKCTIGDVYSQIKPILDSVKSPVADLSYDDTLLLTKRLTSLYFTTKCQTPSFCYAFANVSTCQINKVVYTEVEANIQRVMEEAGSAVVFYSDDLTSDQLTGFADQLFSITRLSFLISHRYASTHTLLCTNLILFRYLAAKIPGSTANAKQLLTDSIDYCSKGLNDDEYEMMDTFYKVDFKQKLNFQGVTRYLWIDFTSEDKYSWSCSPCSNGAYEVFYNCGCSCDVGNFETFVVNPVKETYKKIFSPAYCELRDKLSLLNTPANIVAVQCHDQSLYIEQAFSHRQWYARDRPGGTLLGVYDEQHREASGTLIKNKKGDYFINVLEKAVYQGSNIRCLDVTFYTRCDVGVPGLGGPCYETDDFIFI